MLDESRGDGFLSVEGLRVDQQLVRDEELSPTRADDQDARSLSGA
jgi:hypothetical protein